MQTAQQRGLGKEINNSVFGTELLMNFNHGVEHVISGQASEGPEDR